MECEAWKLEALGYLPPESVSADGFEGVVYASASRDGYPMIRLMRSPRFLIQKIGEVMMGREWRTPRITAVPVTFDEMFTIEGVVSEFPEAEGCARSLEDAGYLFERTRDDGVMVYYKDEGQTGGFRRLTVDFHNGVVSATITDSPAVNVPCDLLPEQLFGAASLVRERLGN